MFMLIVLAALSVLAIGWTVVALIGDGYRPARTDWTRLPDARP
jgi:hypothetical protein